MAVYLETNPPRVSQFRRTRRAEPSGVIVLHTAESMADLTPPDNGAGNVARFIVNRTNFGSYHAIVDADSAIQLCEWSWEAWHVGTFRMNYHSVGISVACEADKWSRYPESWVDGAVDNAARMAAAYASWLEANHNITIPADRINATQAVNRTPGFTTHGELDPTRRTDPGPDFPWDKFLARYRHHRGQPDDMNDRQTATIVRIQQALIDAGYDLGSFGADGDPGALTEAAVRASIQDRNDARRQIQTLTTDLQACQDAAQEDSREAQIGRGFIDLVNKTQAID